MLLWFGVKHPRHGNVLVALQNVQAVCAALAQHCPAAGVVVCVVGRVFGQRGNLVLQDAEVGEDFCHAGCAVVVYYTAKGDKGPSC